MVNHFDKAARDEKDMLLKTLRPTLVQKSLFCQKINLQMKKVWYIHNLKSVIHARKITKIFL